MVLLIAIVLSTVIPLTSCMKLPTPAIEPAESAAPEGPSAPVPAPAPVSAPAPVPIPSPPPVEEKPHSNGLIQPQTSSTTPDGGANKLYMEIEGIPGESTDAKHGEWIDVLAFSHGVSQPGGGATTSRTTERSRHEDFTVTKELDKSSPKLALACCNGMHIPEVVIEVCRADTGEKYMRYILNDVIVASVSQDGSSQGAEGKPMEEVSLSYGKISWSYTEMDPMTGKAKGNVEAYWDLETNKGG
jgi:type VI secretion system secreted protein Hcp